MLNKWLKRLKKNERGLTLVELLAVIVILAIVAGIAFVMIGNVMENSRKDAHIANAQQAIAAAKLYEASGETIGDGDGDGDAGIAISDLQSEGYLGALTSPWNDTEGHYTDEGTIDEGARVTKDGDSGVFSVTFEGAECTISNTSETDLNSDSRDEICGGDGDGDGDGDD